MAIFQPSPGSPSRLARGTTTSSRNSSQNSAWPVICVIGRSSTPGACMSTISIEMPRCGRRRRSCGPARRTSGRTAPTRPRSSARSPRSGRRGPRRASAAMPGPTRRPVREALAQISSAARIAGEVAAALLVAAEAQQRRSQHVEADDVGELRRAGRRQLLVDDDLLGGRRAPPRTRSARPGPRSRRRNSAPAMSAGPPCARRAHAADGGVEAARRPGSRGSPGAGGRSMN